MCVYAKEGKEERDRERKCEGGGRVEDRYREAQRIRGERRREGG